ncbi:hypothetical protein PTE31013_01733 [Pandoraea terrigena]|uniref:Uncharacterized protein n=1 Tax=Pandoraea terrigena TaxID=2508292 RepID=A0A5E4TYH8_9BURK|nr:hypothetical protein PTE31013_01733 [Pandoraea terrigena]
MRPRCEPSAAHLPYHRPCVKIVPSRYLITDGVIALAVDAGLGSIRNQTGLFGTIGGVVLEPLGPLEQCWSRARDLQDAGASRAIARPRATRRVIPKSGAPTTRRPVGAPLAQTPSGDAFRSFVDQPVPYGVVDQFRMIVESELVLDMCNV